MALLGTITINGSERDLAYIEPEWIAQQINGHRKDGHRICLQLALRSPVALNFASAGCGHVGGGGASNWAGRERLVIDLWNKHDLSGNDIEPGRVIAFLQKLESAF